MNHNQNAILLVVQAQKRMFEIVYLKARTLLSGAEQNEIEKLLKTQEELFRAMLKAVK